MNYVPQVGKISVLCHLASLANSTQSSEVLAVIQAHEANAMKHGCATLARCKEIGNTMKAQDLAAAQALRSLTDIMPAREVFDKLVQAYLRTFRTVLGILHVPSFCQEYNTFWCDPESASKEFVNTLLLVMCIGSTFSSKESGVSRELILQCMHIVSTWLSSPGSRLVGSLDRLRIQCLFFLACQARSVKFNILEGNLLKTAMQLGLHIDAEKHSFRPMSASDVESRRRLWATVLELELQSSMDCGTLLSIDGDDYDCASSLNIDDASLQTKHSVSPKPMDQLTQSSIQILLMRTMPTRLRIARFINSFRSGDSFEQALSLSANLLAELKTCTSLIEAYRMSSSPPTTFQTKLFDLLVYRLLLGLHHPFAVKAMSNPMYYYSRKLCRETAMSLLSPSLHSGDDDFHQLRLQRAGPFRNVYRQCALYMCRELMNPMEVDTPFSADPGGRFIQEEARKAACKYIELARLRIEAGDKSIKCYVLVSGLLAWADATQAGQPVEPEISAALKRSLETCRTLLSSHIRTVSELHDMQLTLTTSIDEQFDWSQWDSSVGQNATDLSPQSWINFSELGL
ncbi:putative C6 transcription factor [Mollisia scopiformis]|uniref:Putative C6 transcription factor n=1 Tax=Mollisia scopiformis TaxID=149040 RepID=A0A132BBJ2_MOLSC|nr:putative C6 transcription factor [Mollisia scopiformis]KUJ09017.1 putative C6 transcription factor [Mollisia scopiformis]